MRGGIGMTENNCTTLNHSENKIFPRRQRETVRDRMGQNPHIYVGNTAPFSAHSRCFGYIFYTSTSTHLPAK